MKEKVMSAVLVLTLLFGVVAFASDGTVGKPWRVMFQIYDVTGTPRPNCSAPRFTVKTYRNGSSISAAWSFRNYTTGDYRGKYTPVLPGQHSAMVSYSGVEVATIYDNVYNYDVDTQYAAQNVRFKNGSTANARGFASPMTLTSAYDAAKVAASQTSVNAIPANPMIAGTKVVLNATQTDYAPAKAGDAMSVTGDLSATMKTSVTAACTASTPTAAAVTGDVNGNVVGTVGKSAMTLAAADVSGNLPSDVKAITTGVDFNAAMKSSLNASTPASVTGAVASVTAPVTVGTNNDKTGYTISTVSDKTGYSLASAYDPAKTCAQAATALNNGTWTDAKAAGLDTTISSRMAASGYVAPDNAGITAIEAKTATLPASPAAVGSAMTLTAAYDAAKTAASQTSMDAAFAVTDAKIDAQLTLLPWQGTNGYASPITTGSERTIFAGDDVTIPYAVTQPDPAHPGKYIPLDLTGYTVKFAMKRNITDKTYAIAPRVITSMVDVPATAGTGKLVIASADTKNLAPATYTLDLVVYDGSGLQNLALRITLHIETRVLAP